MKYLFSTIIIILCIQNLKAQNITIDDLVTLRTRDAIGANDLMNKKSWVYHSSSNFKEENATVISWVYPKTSNQISLINDSQNERTTAMYTSLSKVTFDAFKAHFLLKSPEVTNSNVSDGSIHTEYFYKGLRIVFSVNKEDDKTEYVILVSNSAN